MIIVAGFHFDCEFRTIEDVTQFSNGCDDILIFVYIMTFILTIQNATLKLILKKLKTPINNHLLIVLEKTRASINSFKSLTI